MRTSSIALAALGLGLTQIAAAITLPASGSAITRTETSVFTHGSEQAPCSPNGTGWKVHVWGDIQGNDFICSPETTAGLVHSGSRSSHFRVHTYRTTGGLEFMADSGSAYTAGKRYKTTFWIKASANASLDGSLRKNGPGAQYQYVRINATTSWQQITVEGFSGDSASGFYLQNLPVGVDFYVDDFEVKEVVQDEVVAGSLATAIPDTLFGMHINQLGSHNSWPKAGQKLIRLHDTGTGWLQLEPTRGSLPTPPTSGNSRLEYYVNHVTGHDASAQILYTMGLSPNWASTAGTFTTPPDDLEDWRTYARYLATNYCGRIRYWELWNEWDIPTFYTGSVSKMVDLARVAREELVGTSNPCGNVIVSPSITAGSLGRLDAFLRAGGGAYVDVIAYHDNYPDSNPENIGKSAANVREVMTANGVGTKPLWNTEGVFQCDQSGCTDPDVLTDSSRGASLRGLLAQWTRGVSNFDYRYWDAGYAFNWLVHATATATNCPAYYQSGNPGNINSFNPDCATELGKAYAESTAWIKGAQVTDAYTAAGTGGTIHVYKLTAQGQSRVIAWTTGSNETVTLPSGWSALTRVKAIGSAEADIAVDRNVPLTKTPVLLKPQTTITVNAKGNAAGGVDPQMQLVVDNVVVGTVSVSSSGFADYVFPLSGSVAPGTKVDVVFTNDGAVGSEDRNLQVWTVTINGTAIQSDATGVVYDHGVGAAAFDGINTMPGQEWMYWNGALRFLAP